MKLIFLSLLLTGFSVRAQNSLDKIAEDYVKLGLEIGLYDGDFVDAYYGPDSLRPQSPKLMEFPQNRFLNSVRRIQKELQPYVSSGDSVVRNRAVWMQQQLLAFSRRIKIFSGMESDFDTESRELFGLVAPTFPESYFIDLLAGLDAMLPGNGSIGDRFQSLASRFILPNDKIDSVFRLAITEARKRTLAHYALPTTEDFVIEYVKEKPWSGYNWYRGHYKSLIQINTDLPVYAERAIDLACHEGYPGHHVYNASLEEKLFRDKGRVEISLYPLFSPQSFIAEGSANFGIGVAFPGRSQMEYVRDHLLPVAGLDTAGISLYFQALSLRGKLNYARNEVARGIVNRTMTDSTGLVWLEKYNLFTKPAAEKSLRFIKKYRSYVINYNFGQDVVRKYVERHGGTENNAQNRWQVFQFLLSNSLTTADLMK